MAHTRNPLPSPRSLAGILRRSDHRSRDIWKRKQSLSNKILRTQSGSELLPDRFSEKFREIDFPDRSKGIISLGRNLPFPGEVKEEGGDREIPGRRGMGSADIPRRGGGCIKLEA